MTLQGTKRDIPIFLAREQQLITLLMAFLATGLLFMILPGTFLGVWNLFTISSAQSATSISAAWIQAHGHAQLFGWIGSFILGIGFYSIPNLRRVSDRSFVNGWLTWGLWTAGVALRWFAVVYLWQWRLLLPLSAMLELMAVVIFLFRSLEGHGMQRKAKGAVESWTALVIAGSIGLLCTMVLNACQCMSLAMTGSAPVFPPEFNSTFLTLAIWGFPVPVVWGFTAHWMPALLGLRPLRSRLIFLALAVLLAGVVAAFVRPLLISSTVLLMSAVLVVLALRLLEPSERPAKIAGVHATFPVFIRIAYAWLLIGSLLLVWAAMEANSLGIGGAGRHALTVGFLMTMVFTVGPRMVPAFLGRRKLFSERLMLLALLLTNTGCFLRVLSEIIAYQHQASWAWLVLPASATLELVGVVVFTINLVATFRQPPLLTSGDC